MLIYPLATLLFSTTGRKPTTYTPPPASDPFENSRPIGPTMNVTDLYLRRQSVNYAALPMRRPEADLLLSYLKPSDIYLEYGASATTLAFPDLVSAAYSIEHDAHVCKGISSEMLSHKITSSKLRAFCAPVPIGRANWGLNSPFEEGSYRAFHNYVDFPRNNLSNVIFDRVLINGRARVACALRILPQLKPSSLVFLHDFFLRPGHYAEVLTFYDEVARVVATGDVRGYSDDPMGMLVLQPKAAYAGRKEQVTATRLNRIYDIYAEVEPTKETAGMEVALRYGLLKSIEGGYPYYENSRRVAQETTRMRLVLDLVALPFIILTYLVVRDIFRKVFLEALSSSSHGTRFSALWGRDSGNHQASFIPLAHSPPHVNSSSKAE